MPRTRTPTPPRRLTQEELALRILTLPPLQRQWAIKAVLQRDPLLKYQVDAQVVERNPADQALYDACRRDHRLFALTFFPQMCELPFSAMHDDFFAEFDAALDTRNQRTAREAPRGHAKTTIRAVIRVIHDMLYGIEPYTLVVSSRLPLAKQRVKGVRSALESNIALERVFGPQKGPTWNEDDIITAGGARLLAAAPGSQVRGLLWITPTGAIRPTKVLLDDADNSEHVNSALQREKLWDFVMSDLAKLGGPTGKALNIDAIGTRLHPDAMIARMIQNPGFEGKTYRAVRAFATATTFWQEWRQLFIDLTNPTRQEDALAFFHAHEADMLRGADVLWPEGDPYYNLMVMRVVEGEAAFWKEKQNDPTRGQDLPFDMDAAAYVNVTPQGIARVDGVFIPWHELQTTCSYWDPALESKTGRPTDYSCCVVMGMDQWGYVYVLDAYCTQGANVEQQQLALAQMLFRWRIEQVGLEVNNFQSLLKGTLLEALAQEALDIGAEQWTPMLVPVQNMKNKVRRIMTLQPLVANHWLQFADTLPAAFLQQFRDFRPIADAGYDDAPDATEAGVRLLRQEHQTSRTR